MRFACSVTNGTDNDAVVLSRDCGCHGENGTCAWGPVTVAGAWGETLSLTFCDMSASTNPGVVAVACSVTFPNGTMVTKSCGQDVDGVDVSCSGPTMTLPIPDGSGQQLNVQFCPLVVQDDKSDGRDDDGDRNDCVPMNARTEDGEHDDDKSEGSDRPRPPTPGAPRDGGNDKRREEDGERTHPPTQTPPQNPLNGGRGGKPEGGETERTRPSTQAPPPSPLSGGKGKPEQRETEKTRPPTQAPPTKPPKDDKRGEKGRDKH